jgi:hypothetical protein
MYACVPTALQQLDQPLIYVTTKKGIRVHHNVPLQAGQIIHP